VADQMITGATEIVTAEHQQSQVNKLGEAAARGVGADPGTARSVGDAVEITAVLGPVLNNIARNIANRLLGTGGAAAGDAAAAASGEAQAGKTGKTVGGEGSPSTGGTAATKGGAAGKNTDRAGLQKQLTSENQLNSAGEDIAGGQSGTEFRNADRVAKQYGGNAEDWVKKSSEKAVMEDGTYIETHWVENIKTGQRVEAKTKIVPEECK
jgi:hypothetical protein